MSNDKDTVDLSPPGAADYKARIEAAKAGRTPVGGVEMPKMPRLDQPPPGAPANRHLGVQQAHSQQAAHQGSAHQPMTPEQYQAAVASGQAIPGVGAAYAANQPRPMEMVGSEGPVNPPRPGGGLRPETQQALEAIAKANDESPEDDDSKESDEEFFSKLSEASKDIINNKERRDAIESKITDELSFEDLFVHRELRQKVPILKGFTPVFRTSSGDEDLFVKRLISDERGSDRYIMDKFALMNLCCGLFSLSGKPLPDHRDKDGDPDEDLFKAKFKVMMKYPLIVLADLSANYTWFQERVQKLFSVEEVKRF